MKLLDVELNGLTDEDYEKLREWTTDNINIREWSISYGEYKKQKPNYIFSTEELP